ncbi:MAG: hypothetical protein HYS17_04915 [Micavibrio aeruginosavorus]|uniref:Uncharacterized protein n=1 Tax=Micavibrio aeruginosavorus TaxID=349221 RepID=A0A7T5R408_9BACT|nr:MAG: hypothetical protein HYS17_04915 [Micavibrio aeruginosavorus]
MDIKIDKAQFDAIIFEISKIDWWNIGSDFTSQLILVLIAAGSGYYFQRLIQKQEDKNQSINRAHEFNEAVIYLSSILEIIAHHISQLILPSYSSEKTTFAELQTTPTQNPHVQLRSIRHIEPPSEDLFLKKISDIGSQADIVQVFFRMKNETSQLQTICEERNFLLKKFMDNDSVAKLPQYIISRYAEIHQRTFSLLISSEAIFDECLFISRKLETLADKEKSYLKNANIQGIDIFKLERNPFYEELRIKLKNELNKFPELQGRMLHIQ